MEKEINKSYLSQIQKYPLLSAEEESELAVKISGGDQSALKALVNSNLRLVVSLACRFKNSCVSVMDLVQEGNLGLMIAAQKFQAEFNTRFSTYAYPWIVQYMMRFANTKSAFISLPHRKDDLIRKVVAAQATLMQCFGREATVYEVSEYLGIEPERIDDCMQYNYSISSLDVDAGDEDSSATVADLMPDMTYCPERVVLEEEQKESVRSILNKLPQNERRVLWYRYNFDGSHSSKTLREISRIIGVSPEAVRQTEIRALRHMRLAACADSALVS